MPHDLKHEQRNDHDNDNIKPFLLPNPSFLSWLLSIPSNIWFAISGLLGLASYTRQIVSVAPRSPAAINISRSHAKLANGDSKGVRLDDWVERNVPSLKGVVRPAWWLPK